MSWTTPEALYKTAAVIYAISAPGHMALGFTTIYPALNKIPLVGDHVIGKRGAQNCWNYVAASLVVAASLNWQWARTGGPQSLEENVVFWVINGMHAINGLRYAQVGAYGPLAPMWLAPILTGFAKYKA